MKEVLVLTAYLVITTLVFCGAVHFTLCLTDKLNIWDMRFYWMIPLSVFITTFFIFYVICPIHDLITYRNN